MNDQATYRHLGVTVLVLVCVMLLLILISNLVA